MSAHLTDEDDAWIDVQSLSSGSHHEGSPTPAPVAETNPPHSESVVAPEVEAKAANHEHQNVKESEEVAQLPVEAPATVAFSESDSEEVRDSPLPPTSGQASDVQETIPGDEAIDSPEPDREWSETEDHMKDIWYAEKASPTIPWRTVSTKLKILVTGQPETGRSTTIRNLFASMSQDPTWYPSDVSSLQVNDFLNTPSKFQTTINNCKDTKERLSVNYVIQETPGLVGCPDACARMLVDYVKQLQDDYAARERDVTLPRDACDDNRVDVVLYFLTTNARIGDSELDTKVIHALAELVPVIPVMCKADGLLEEEVLERKAQMERLVAVGLPVFKFPEDIVAGVCSHMLSLSQGGSSSEHTVAEDAPPFRLPFNVVVSNQVDETVHAFWFVRKYRWGVCESYRTANSDLKLLRQLLLEDGFWAIKDAADKLYRTQQARRPAPAPPAPPTPASIASRHSVQSSARLQRMLRPPPSMRVSCATSAAAAAAAAAVAMDAAAVGRGLMSGAQTAQDAPVQRRRRRIVSPVSQSAAGAPADAVSPAAATGAANATLSPPSLGVPFACTHFPPLSSSPLPDPSEPADPCFAANHFGVPFNATTAAHTAPDGVPAPPSLIDAVPATFASGVPFPVTSAAATTSNVATALEATSCLPLLAESESSASTALAAPSSVAVSAVPCTADAATDAPPAPADDPAPPPPPPPAADVEFDASVYKKVTVGDVTRSGSEAKSFRLTLHVEGEDKILCMRVGEAEGNALLKMLHGTRINRPSTYDSISGLLRSLDCNIKRVLITECSRTVFYSVVHAVSQRTGTAASVDARPSDAINLAIRDEAPMYLHTAIVNKYAKRAT